MNGQEEYSESLQKYGYYDRIFCKQLHDLLIMRTLVDGNSLETKKFFIDRSDPQQWEFQDTSISTSASSLVGSTEKIHISNVRKNLIKAGILPSTHKQLAETLLSQEDQQHYQQLFTAFLKRNNFFLYFPGSQDNNNKETKAKERYLSANRKTFKHIIEAYEHTSKKNISIDEFRLIRDSHLVLIHMLHKKNSEYILENGEISPDGLQFLADVFHTTKKHSGGALSKIFHDGDYGFLFEDDGRGHVKPYLLHHYAHAIKYLMDSESKNTLYMHDEEGHSTWKRKRKSFVNRLLITGQEEVEKVKVEENPELSFHGRLAPIWHSTIRRIQGQYPNIHMEASNRAKTASSKYKKKLGRPTQITDESGVRVTLFGEHLSDEISVLLLTIMRDYIAEIDSLHTVSPDLDVKIKSISLDKKGSLVHDEDFEHKKCLNNCSCLTCSMKHIFSESDVRKNNKKTHVNLSKYMALIHLDKDPLLKYCTNICLGNVSRGKNGNYRDVKFILELEVNGQTFYQEVSVWNHTNGFGLNSPRVLKMEKDIFERAKNRHDEDKGMSVSLGSVITFIEEGIKGMSADADMAEVQLREKGLLEKTPPYYKEITIDGKTYSLEGLWERSIRTARNIDEIICALVNYFITSNKLIYFNTNNNRSYSGLVTPELIYDAQFRSQMRFLTSDTIKFMVEEPLFSDTNISIYYSPKDGEDTLKEGFYSENLGRIGTTLFVLEQAKYEKKV